MTAALLLALLSACVSPPRLKPLPGQELWRASGKIGWVAEGKAKSANFDWQHRGRDYELHLSGVLGIGSTRLLKQQGTLTLLSNQGSFQADSEEQLLEQVLGLRVPVAELIYWIKGQASPNAIIAKRVDNPNGTPQVLEQQGWRITYRQYTENTVLPKKIIAQRDGLKLTLIIKTWQI